MENGNASSEFQAASPGVSRSASSSSLVVQSSVPTPLLHSESHNSSTSSFSRASSVRSTDSVQAVQVKTPLRVVTPAASRHNSNSVYVTPYMFRRRSTTTNPYGPNDPINPHDILPPTLPSGQMATLPDHISIAPSATFNMSMPSPSISMTSSMPPTPGGFLPSTLLRPTSSPVKAGLSRTASSLSVGVIVRRSVQDFEFGDILGEGSYSTVYAVSDRLPPHREYALKILDKRHIVKERKQKYVNIEKDTLNRLERHPGIIRLYWTFHDERSLYFVLELAKNGEILNLIKQYGSFNLPCARYYAAQLLSAVEHIHSQGVIHRDLKPENILLDHNMRIKVTDFGTAKLLEKKDGAEIVDDRANSFVGTAEYVSPELLSSKTAYRSSDFWALGCIIYQFLVGKPPFKAANEYLTFQKIINLEYTFPDGFPPDAKDLVERLLIRDPQLRLGANGVEEIKRHPFFESINFPTIWNIDPPPLQSGLTPPQPRGKYQLEQYEADYFSSMDEVEQDQWRPPQMALHHHAGVESVDSSASSAEKQTSSMDVPAPHLPSLSDPQAAKWLAHLLPSELLIMSSMISDKSGIFSKKRLLILTDYPRLLLAREQKNSLKIKHEIFFGQQRTPSLGPSSNGKAVANLECLLEVKEEGAKGFRIFTTSRSYRFEDPSGLAPRWLVALRKAQVQATSNG